MKRLLFVLFVAGVMALPAAADSLFSRRVADRGPAVSQKRAQFSEGDIIIVLVRESIDASTRSDTNTKKESEISAQSPVRSNTFLVAERPDGLGLINPERPPNWNIDVENEHRGRGSTQRSNTLTTTIACTVTKVHANGNLEIMGSRQVTVNREDSTVMITGTVRSRDVSPENTVPSDRVANAVVELRGKGPLWNNERRGLLTRFLDWFSPF